MPRACLDVFNKQFQSRLVYCTQLLILAGVGTGLENSSVMHAGLLIFDVSDTYSGLLPP